MGMLKNIKPNVEDFPDVFLGKLKSMSVMAKAVSDRNSKISEYVRNGMSPVKAIEKAKKETDLVKIKKDYDNRYKEDQKNELLKSELSKRNNKQDAPIEYTKNGKTYVFSNGEWYQK
jgi:hypothetical protein